MVRETKRLESVGGRLALRKKASLSPGWESLDPRKGNIHRHLEPAESYVSYLLLNASHGQEIWGMPRSVEWTSIGGVCETEVRAFGF